MLKPFIRALRSWLVASLFGKLWICLLKVDYKILYNELCKTRVLIGLEECVIRV